MWNCARALTRYLETRTEAVRTGVDAVEIGAGTGLCGIAAAILGASVLLTDKRGMVDLLGDNVAANAEAIERAGGRCAVEALAWGQPGHSLYRARHDFVLASGANNCIISRKILQTFCFFLFIQCAADDMCTFLMQMSCIIAPMRKIFSTRWPDCLALTQPAVS